MPFKDCAELASYLYKHQPPPQDLNFQRSSASPRSGDMLDSVNLPDRKASAPSVFQPVPESQLASIDEAAVAAPALRLRGRPGRGGGGAQPEVLGRMGRGRAEERGVPTAARRLPLRLELSAERRSSLRLRPRRGDC